MPTYEYRCPDCADFDLVFEMRSVPDSVSCPTCACTARRRMSAPGISTASSAAFRLIDDTKRSAHEPVVVNSPAPGRRSGPAQKYTLNPLHKKLPRP